MAIVQQKLTELSGPVGGIQDADLFYLVDMDGDAGNPLGTKVTAQEILEYLRFATAGLDLWVVKRAVWRNLATDSFGDQMTVSSGSASNSAATADQPQMQNLATNSSVGNAAVEAGLQQYWFNRRLWFTTIFKPVNSDARYWAGVMTNVAGATIAAASAPLGNLIGFRYDPGAGDTNWQFCHSDGATFTAVDTGVAPDFSASPQLLEYRLTGSGLVNVYIDRDLVLSDITPLISTTTAIGYMNSVTNLVGGSNRNLRWSQSQVAQYYL